MKPLTLLCVMAILVFGVGQLAAKSLRSDDANHIIIQRHQNAKEAHHMQRLQQLGEADAKRSAISAESHHSHRLHNHRKHHRPYQPQHPNQITNQMATAPTNCPKCRQGLDGSKTTAQSSARVVTEDELTRLRIAFAKNQILKKLRLTDIPNVRLSGVPRPVAEGATYRQRDSNAYASDANADGYDEENMNIADDFYAKTNQKIIFPELDAEHCSDTISVGASMCFRFTVPPDIERQSIASAELWVYKQPHISDKNITFVFGEVEMWQQNRYTKPFAIQESNNTEAWVKIKIEGKMEHWFIGDDVNDTQHIIEVRCATCEPHPSISLLRLDHDYRPFIVVNTYSGRPMRRPKRNINCSATTTSCCRDSLYISFAEIGWNDWILQPPGYHAYFCRGSCASAASITLSDAYYNTAIRKVMYTDKGKSLDLVPCCTPTKFSSLQLLYTDSNNSVTQQTLPGMVVESCGCM